jgi:hypothetical protein
MHEKVPRSKGGEISLENSEGRCYECHLGEFGAHKNRLLKFTKRSITIGPISSKIEEEITDN